MKTWIALVAMVVVLSSCKTAAYFETPNDLNYISGTLYLTNGEKIDGKLSINESTGGPVKLYVDGEKRPQRYRYLDVEGYSVRNEFYEYKEILDGMSFNRAYRFRFMKRITNERSKIHVYEYLDRQTHSRGYRRGASFTSVEKTYYVQLPSEKEDGVWNINMSKFTPNFDEKMSKIVNDCPALSQKIANKEKGYFYSQMRGSKEERVDLLLNIIKEYNQCQR